MQENQDARNLEGTTPKKRRQDAIREMIQNRPIERQSEIVSGLEALGFRINQSTVSRDIKELRLIKVATTLGRYVYALPKDVREEACIPQRLIRIFSESIVSVVEAENIVVVKTLSGSAGAVGEAIDGLMWPEIAGTLAGDNTIMIVSRTREEAMTKEERVREILARLDNEYGTDLACYLHHDDAWQLLVATILSAQCTDARVNEVTPGLFAKYDSVEKFAEADLAELEQDIRSTGFYHNKAKNIILAARKLMTDFGGEVPSDIDELTSLPGVGRKTANVIRGNIYHIPSVVVDTHVGRVSRKLGLTKNEDPEKVEHDLEKKLPQERWILWNLQIIAHGRAICTARSPKCTECFLAPYCPEGSKPSM